MDVWVLDTHVLIWYFTGNRRLKNELKNKIDQTRSRGGRLLIPTIVLAEALSVAEKGRVKFDFKKMYNLIRKSDEFEIVDLTPEILEEAMKIKKISEIHDRLIVATANFYKAGIITKDKVILDSGETTY